MDVVDLSLLLFVTSTLHLCTGQNGWVLCLELAHASYVILHFLFVGCATLPLHNYQLMRTTCRLPTRINTIVAGGAGWGVMRTLQACLRNIN